MLRGVCVCPDGGAPEPVKCKLKRGVQVLIKVCHCRTGVDKVVHE